MSTTDRAEAHAESPRRLAVFCDFDGTFLVQDVGSTLARKYVLERRSETLAHFLRGELTPWECNMEILDGMPVPEEDLEAFLQQVELDPGAEDLLGWCEAKEIPFRILSDGFDRNIDRLKEIFGIEFDYDSNHLRYEDGVWRIAPGYPNPKCGCGTGVCKRGRIDAYRALNPNAFVVHIGNGRISDLCGVLGADLGFAKDTLALALDERGIDYRAFKTLKDVVEQLDELLRDAAFEVEDGR